VCCAATAFTPATDGLCRTSAAAPDALASAAATTSAAAAVVSAPALAASSTASPASSASRRPAGAADAGALDTLSMARLKTVTKAASE
jgi:hypothetical protein